MGLATMIWTPERDRVLLIITVVALCIAIALGLTAVLMMLLWG